MKLMTTEEFKRQIYLLGQIYGRIIRECPDLDTNLRFRNACTNPMAGTTFMFLTAMKAQRITPEMKEYIIERYNDVDADIGERFPINIELQGTFQFGYFNAQRDFNAKKTIDRIGLTQQEIADKLEVSSTIVGRWYRGEAVPRIRSQYELEKLAWENNK